ncbi:centrosomal protein [Cystoisospora suis]|uniref:Centrosomal protein n=1 Tax=Cystoisospora suis TaxID=483139 RepID=A0A2C6L1B3_9APIC|nr:centrosomal protein [Cystoisospora suis]
MVSSNRATVRELGLRLQQQEQQRLFAERRLQQVESVAAKHAQEVINLRSECRLLRASARGVSTGSSAASDAQADADPFSELSIPSTSAPRSDVLSPGELRGTLNRVLAALSIPEGVNHPFWHNGHFGFSGAYCAGRTPSVGPTWEKQANQDLDIFAALDREESPVKEQSDDEASKPKEVSAEAQGVLAQLDGLCCFLEYISGRAEWLLKEWRDLKASPTFREVLISRLGPRLPPNQVAWLSTEVDNQDVHTAGASSPLLEWLAVSAQLMECLNSLSADASSDTATALDTACVGTPTATVSRDINRKRSGGGVSRQSSVRDDSAPVNGGDDASLCPQGQQSEELKGATQENAHLNYRCIQSF